MTILSIIGFIAVLLFAVLTSVLTVQMLFAAVWGLCLFSISPILCHTYHRHPRISLASVTLRNHHENYLGITMNPRIHDIALATGGSFYPAVGGNLLEQSVLMAVRQCIAIALDNDDIRTAESIAQHFGIDE